MFCDRVISTKCPHIVLLHALVTGHPLVDGNKRLGWVAVRLFYRMNDLDIHAQVDGAFELVLAVADGRIRDVTAIAERLRSWRHASG